MATKKMQPGGSKKSLIKAQYGEIAGASTTKKNIFGRKKVTTPETGTWRDGSTSKSVSTKTYDSKGNYLKNKSKSTSTYPDGDKQTMIVKHKAGQGNPFKIRRGITPVQKTGGTTKMKKYAMGGIKKPLRKKQPGGMAGPITESDSNFLDETYPSSSSVRIPAAPKDYNADNFNPGFGFNNDPVEGEMKNRMASEKGLRSSPDFNNGPVYKKGGATRKMQKGGPNVIQSMRKNMLNNKENRLIDRGVKNMKAGNVEKGRAQFEKSNDVGYKRRHLADKYKTGGMVNANSKIAAAKKATGRSGGTTKAISKVAVKSASPKGRVGGTSTAPKKALPKAQMGTIVNRPKTSGGKPKAERNLLKKEDPTLGGRIPKVFIGKGKPKAGGLILKNMSKAKMGGMKGKSC